MSRTSFIRVWVALFLAPFVSGDAHADGGSIRLRESRGPFVITIFISSDPVMEAPVDVSVMVQNVDSREVILDAAVTLEVVPETVPATVDGLCGMGGAGFKRLATNPPLTEFSVAATHGQSSNKLLYAAPVRFGAAGNWKIQASVEKKGDAVKADCEIFVGTSPSKLAALLPFLALPPVLVVLFGLNQFLRKPSLEKASLLNLRLSRFAPSEQPGPIGCHQVPHNSRSS